MQVWNTVIGSTYPKLKKLAVRYLSTITTSTPSERLFLKAGSTLYQQRNRMKVDIEFDNPAHFIGTKAATTEGQFIVTYLSHAMLFCVGALLEAHVVLTPASCVIGETVKFDVYAGTHKFREGRGITRQVHHLCVHRGYNHTQRWSYCSPDNIALLVLQNQFVFNVRDPDADFIINRIRYGLPTSTNKEISCHYYGWASRRNGYLIPLLIDLRRADAIVLPSDKCLEMWNNKGKYLCIQQPPCKDDMGTVMVCNGYARGMMTSRLVDRPCGVGFLDLTLYNKFITCGVDDSRDVVDISEDTINVPIREPKSEEVFTVDAQPVDNVAADAIKDEEAKKEGEEQNKKEEENKKEEKEAEKKEEKDEKEKGKGGKIVRKRDEYIKKENKKRKIEEDSEKEEDRENEENSEREEVKEKDEYNEKKEEDTKKK